MAILIEKGEVFSPAPLGRTDLLIIGDSIQKVGKIDREALARLDLETEFVDASDCFVVPGLIDPHEHLLGGSGEQGFSSQTPELHLSEIVCAGITTVIGCLGVDTTMKTMPGLLARAKALKEEGLSACIWSGGYNVPPTTITTSIRDDVLFIEEVIGAGEIAIADERSTDPTAQELARLTNDVYVGGMLSRKAGVTHFHVGDGKGRLHLLRQLLDDFGTPPETIYPTHVQRNEQLLDEAIELTHRGCFVDFDTAAEDLQKWVTYYFKHDGDPARLTLSSDASIGSPSNILNQLRKCVRNSEFELAQVLPLATANTAEVLKLKDRGKLEPKMKADVLVLDRKTLELREVIARGRRLLKDGKALAAEAFIEDSNRSIQLVGKEAQD
jgi:beta-aspartyl-dipeptidase (metallo-type)